MISERRELHAPVGIKIVRGLHQAELAVRNQIVEFHEGGQAAMNAARDRPHQALVREDELIRGVFGQSHAMASPKRTHNSASRCRAAGSSSSELATQAYIRRESASRCTSAG